jgi:predicted dienelactone hydrolase
LTGRLTPAYPSAMRRALVTVLLVGCGRETLAPVGSEPEPALGPTYPGFVGPYAVGVTTLSTVVEGRTLPIEVWYPALPGGAPSAYSLMLGSVVLATVPSPLGAVRDAAVDARGMPHPVVVFSHGFGGTRLQSYYLTEHLASHGFVVAAPDHVGNTLTEQVNSAAAIPPAVVARLRPLDVSAALDAVLDAMPGAADVERAAVAGHSFGGFTALRVAGATVDVDAASAACAADPTLFFCDGWPGSPPLPESARDDRFAVAVAQAPGGAAVLGAQGAGAIAVPTMIQAGTLDHTTVLAAEATAPFAALDVDGYLVVLEGAGHFTFSNLCPLVADLGVPQFDDGCGADNVPVDVAHRAIVLYATAFLGARLRGFHSWETLYLGPTSPRPAGVTLLDR